MEERIPLSAFSQITTRDQISENAGTFIGMPVLDYEREQPAAAASPPKKRGFFSFGKSEPEAEPKKTSDRTDVIYRFRSSWDEDNLVPNLEHFLESSLAAQARGMVIGSWYADEPDRTAEGVVELLVKSAAKLPQVTAIYLGDITSEENEMSWIHQCDLTPLLEAFPQLQLLRTRGGDGLKLSKPEHAKLRGLALETGGLDGHGSPLARGWIKARESGGKPPHCKDFLVHSLRPALRSKLGNARGDRQQTRRIHGSRGQV